MARIRTIKPEFFQHEKLTDLSLAHRMLFIGLWTQADGEGRLEDRPKRLKLNLLPYDDVDVDALLQDLHDAGFIVRYEAEDDRFIVIPKFRKHQRIAGKELETPSRFPEPPGKHLRSNGRTTPVSPGSTRETPGKHRGSTREAPGTTGKERNGKGKEEKVTVGTGESHLTHAREGGARPANDHAVAPKLTDDGSASRRDPDPEPLSEVEEKIAAVAAESREMMRLPRRSADEIEALKRRGLDGDDEALRLWEAYAKEAARG